MKKFCYSLFLFIFFFGTLPATAQMMVSHIAGNGPWNGTLGDGGPAVNAQLNQPSGVCKDGKGVLYIADTYNHRIRKVSTTGIITTVAGTGTPGFSGDGGLAVNAQLSMPYGVFTDKYDNLYIADTYNFRIRKIDSAGIITTVTGGGNQNPINGCLATDAFLNHLYALYIDSETNMYIADQKNSVVWKVARATGMIRPFAGNGIPNYYGDGGPATSAAVNGPLGVCGDMFGNIYIADHQNFRVRKVDTAGIITTIAGNGFNNPNFLGDGGLAINAELYPYGISADPSGNIYIADAWNSNIRKIDVQTDSISSIAYRSSAWGVFAESSCSIYVGEANASDGRVSRVGCLFPLGETSLELINLVSVYPNPFTEKLIVTPHDGAVTVSLFDISGRLVNQTWCSDYTVIPVNVPSGIYLLKVTDDRLRSETIKLVAQ